MVHFSLLLALTWILSVTLHSVAAQVAPDQQLTAPRTSRKRDIRHHPGHGTPPEDEGVRTVAPQTLVMICAMLKDEDPYVDEWLRYHFALGFDLIQIYDNSVNASEKLAALPIQYNQRVKVLHYVGTGVQNQAYHNCKDQYVGQKAWAAFLDCDEFIVLRKHRNIRELLSDIVPAGGALSFNRIKFGSDQQQHFENKPVLSRFTKRAAAPEIYVKTIAYLPDVRRIELHFVRLFYDRYGVDCHGNPVKAAVHFSPSEDIAAVNHYFTKSFDEFRAKRLRGHAHSAAAQDKYHSTYGEELIKDEFRRFNAEANAVEDTRAWDWYRATNVGAS